MLKFLYLSIVLLILCTVPLLGQTISPNTNRQSWGGETVQFRRGPVDSGCQVTWTVVNGIFTFDQSTEIIPDGTTANVRWNNVSTQVG